MCAVQEEELDRKREELLELEQHFSKIAGKKRARAEEAAAEEAARAGTPEDLELALVSNQVRSTMRQNGRGCEDAVEKWWLQDAEMGRGGCGNVGLPM
eukprot:1583038-Rhodomonas_salina.2